MNKWIERWQSISGREQFLILGLSLVGVGYVAYSFLYHAQIEKVAHARKNWGQLRQEMEATKTAQVEKTTRAQELEKLAANNEEVRSRVKEMQEKLFSVDELGHLIGELARQAEGLQITLESIKQDIRTEPTSMKVAIEVICQAPYEDLVNFLKRIEQISPFLRLAAMKMKQDKDVPSGWSQNQLVFVAPLRETGNAGVEIKEDSAKTPEKISVKRSPFGSSEPEKTEKASKETVEKLKLTGITWRGKSSSAIVNDQVVRVGDHVGVYAVQQILPQMVIVTNGSDSQAVSMDAQT